MTGSARKEEVRREFRRRARAYSAGVFADEKALEKALGFASPEPRDLVLDVATGAGFLAFAFAERCRLVVALDLTLEMLSRARAVKAASASRALLVAGDVESLPFPGQVFDLVLCRYSFHHFPRPEVALQEMTRVCRDGGRVVVIDGVAPEDAEKAAYLNRMERLRDPGHVKLYSRGELLRFFSRHGLVLAGEGFYELEFSLDEWLDMACLHGAKRRMVASMMEACVDGEGCGVRVERRGGRVFFAYRIGMFMGVRA